MSSPRCAVVNGILRTVFFCMFQQPSIQPRVQLSLHRRQVFSCFHNQNYLFGLRGVGGGGGGGECGHKVPAQTLNVYSFFFY